MVNRFPLVISFFTIGTPYQQEAKRLIESCERFNIEHHIVGIAPGENWTATCALKGPFVAECMRKFERPVLWIDVDAEVVRFPSLFENLECDVAAYRGRRLLSGTVYFGNSDAARNVAEDWSNRCVRRSGVWDQLLLDDALRATRRRVVFRQLPQGYCKIFDKPWAEEPQTAYIVHYQASRRLAGKRARL